MPGIAFDQVVKRFGEVTAVRDLTLDVADGEFVVLVGPSGCGKTTALRMLAGLEAVSSGRILIGDREVSAAAAPPARRGDGVPGLRAVPADDASTDNLAFGAADAARCRASEVRRLVTEAAERLELGELLDRKPRQLSGGQRQRVALGRALVREPQVFLMDEPLSNLDAKLRVQTCGPRSRSCSSEIGMTTVYVTHDQVEAMTMGDRIAVMRDGRARAGGAARRGL